MQYPHRPTPEPRAKGRGMRQVHESSTKADVSGPDHDPSMSVREDPAERGKEKAEAAQLKFRTEVRRARLGQSKSQKVAAAQADIKAPVWSRIETGRQDVGLGLAGRMAGAVGLDLVLQLYASDTVLRDVAHIRLLRDLKATLGPQWRWRLEVPVGDPPDQRAWDAIATHRQTRLQIRVEAETNLRDCQAVLRKVEAKRVADGQPRVLLAIRDSRHNRDAVVEAREELETAFPIPSRVGLALLRRGEDPPGDLLVLVDWVRPKPKASPGTD